MFTLAIIANNNDWKFPANNRSKETTLKWRKGDITDLNMNNILKKKQKNGLIFKKKLVLMY